MYLLDTNICIYLIKRKPAELLHRFEEIETGNIAISSITLSELLFGVNKSKFPEKNFHALEMFTAPLEILPFDSNAAFHYGKLLACLEEKGTPIGSMDTLIAAHALSENATLVTNNEKEFKRVPDLHIENWVSTS